MKNLFYVSGSGLPAEERLFYCSDLRCWLYSKALFFSHLRRFAWDLRRLPHRLWKRWKGPNTIYSLETSEEFFARVFPIENARYMASLPEDPSSPLAPYEPPIELHLTKL